MILTEFKSAAESTTTQETVSALESIEAELAAKYWSSKKVHQQFEEIYGLLAQHEQASVQEVRDELQSLYESEDEKRMNLKSKLNGLLDPDAETIVENESDRLLRRCIAKENETRRKKLKRKLLDAIADIETKVDESESDLPRLERAIEKDDSIKIKEALREFVNHLQHRGWHEEDLIEQADEAIEDDKLPIEFLSRINRSSMSSFTYLMFIPQLQPTSQFTFESSNLRVFPAGELEYETLKGWKGFPALDGQKEELIRQLIRDQNLMGELASIRFSVEAFGENAANNLAINSLSGFLDICIAADQGAYLEDPQYIDRIRYIVWRDDESSINVHASRETQRRARLTQKQLELIDEMHNAVSSSKPLSQRLSRAIHYFRKGIIAHRDIDTAINYIACLETLTTGSDTEKHEAVGNALTFGRVRNSARDEFVELLNTLYDARNAALHSGRSQVILEYDLNRIRALLSGIIFEMKSCIEDNGATDFESFLDYIIRDTKGKYRYEYNRVRQIGFETNTTYSVTGECVTQNGGVKYQFEGKLGFVDDGTYIVADLTMDGLQREGYQISTDLSLNILVDVESRKMIKFGPISAADVMFQDPSPLQFREFEVIDG